MRKCGTRSRWRNVFRGGTNRYRQDLAIRSRGSRANSTKMRRYKVFVDSEATMPDSPSTSSSFIGPCWPTQISSMEEISSSAVGLCSFRGSSISCSTVESNLHACQRVHLSTRCKTKYLSFLNAFLPGTLTDPTMPSLSDFVLYVCQRISLGRLDIG